MEPLTVVGICTYHDAVQRWARTLRAHYDGPCVLALVNTPAGIRTAIGRKFRCKVIDLDLNPDPWAEPPPGRYCRVWGLLAQLCADTVRTPFVMRTDVWDVVFQADPRIPLDPPPTGVLVSRERVRLADDAQNTRWCGRFARADWEVVNGGLLCGPTQAVEVVARVLSRVPFGTEVDQSELTILTNTLPSSFTSRSGYLECLYNSLNSEGHVSNGTFVSRTTGEPWCVVHGNGSTKPTLDAVHPITLADKAKVGLER